MVNVEEPLSDTTACSRGRADARVHQSEFDAVERLQTPKFAFVFNIFKIARSNNAQATPVLILFELSVSVAGVRVSASASLCCQMDDQQKNEVPILKRSACSFFLASENGCLSRVFFCWGGKRQQGGQFKRWSDDLVKFLQVQCREYISKSNWMPEAQDQDGWQKWAKDFSK